MTRSATESFTLTHAKYLASKVTADMKRCQHRYGLPADGDINDYGTELALLLRDGYVSTYEFGFKLANGRRVVSWYYAVDLSGNLSGDERPGGIYTEADISSAGWFNFMSRSTAWWKLGQAERDRFTAGLPFARTPGTEPLDGVGYWATDRTYSSTGVALIRKTFRPYGS